MKLLTKAIESKLPTLDETSEWALGKYTAHVKWFNPTGAGTWYIAAYDPEQRLAFGWCDLGSPELGYVSLDELEEHRGMFGLGIERDLHWAPRPLQDVMEAVAV